MFAKVFDKMQSSQHFLKVREHLAEDEWPRTECGRVQYPMP